jgi:hypothetical protein
MVSRDSEATGNFVDASAKWERIEKRAEQLPGSGYKRLDRTELALEGMLTSGDASAGAQAELPLNDSSATELTPRPVQAPAKNRMSRNRYYG